MKEPLAHLEIIGVVDRVSELVRLFVRRVELFFIFFQHKDSKGRSRLV